MKELCLLLLFTIICIYCIFNKNTISGGSTEFNKIKDKLNAIDTLYKYIELNKYFDNDLTDLFKLDKNLIY